MATKLLDSALAASPAPALGKKTEERKLS